MAVRLYQALVALLFAQCDVLDNHPAQLHVLPAPPVIPAQSLPHWCGEVQYRT